MARKNLRGLKRGNLKDALRSLKQSVKTKAMKKQKPNAAAGGTSADKPAKRLSKADRALQLLEKQARSLLPEDQRTLLVGEGNLSFAAALSKHFGKATGVYATCYDDERTATEKYPDLAVNKREVEEKYGGTALFGIDAARLHEVHEFREAFGRIVWNFPHIGGGEKTVEKSISHHRRLLGRFFVSAQQCLAKAPDAAIHVSLSSASRTRAGGLFRRREPFALSLS